MLEFHYKFEDINHYPNFGSVLFPNPEHISPKDAENLVIKKLMDGMFFLPEKWEIPKVIIDSWQNKNKVRWYQFDKITEADILDRHIMDYTFKEWVKKIKSFNT
ncbi:MAG: hypothetical protein ACEPOW_04655 [Bacteroidales bacterium]